MYTQEQNTQNEVTKAVYEKPAIEIIEMEHEGILCASGDDFIPGKGVDNW